MIVIFWIALLVLLSTYLGYPFCLALLSLFFPKSKLKEFHFPMVSLIIPVYNEEKIIEEKIKNSLSLDYPKDKLEIIVASDGSTDNTKAIVEKYLAQGVRFFDFPRAGKLATLNQVFPYVSGEILVLTDASAMFSKDALQKLLRHFADNNVGVVSGVERIKRVKKSVIDLSERIYWNYETKIKEWEGKIYSTVGANGPIYAIRKELYPALPSHLNICDDMAISMSVLSKGKRIILEPEAVAFEKVSLNLGDEWRRKVRIATGAWGALFFYKKFLIPFFSPIALPLFFHKILRWLTLPVMMVLLISNLFCTSLFYNALLTLQSIFHLFSIISLILLCYNKKIPLGISFLGYFLLTNLAQVVGLFKAIFKPGKPIWQPIQRA